MGSLKLAAQDGSVKPRHSAADIVLFDNFLKPEQQKTLWEFLRGPGWAYGAFSDPAPDAPRYWYKHFAGYVKTGSEARDLDQIEQELNAAAPLAGPIWNRIKTEVLPGHALTRCYANGYPHGAEGGLHLDSNIPTHFTAIYYPHLAWHPNYGGETVFFDETGSDILAAVYPKPNRLVVFPGTIPHVARGVSRKCPELRVTLMFKTAGQ